MAANLTPQGCESYRGCRATMRYPAAGLFRRALRDRTVAGSDLRARESCRIAACRNIRFTLFGEGEGPGSSAPGPSARPPSRATPARSTRPSKAGWRQSARFAQGMSSIKGNRPPASGGCLPLKSRSSHPSQWTQRAPARRVGSNSRAWRPKAGGRSSRKGLTPMGRITWGSSWRSSRR